MASLLNLLPAPKNTNAHSVTDDARSLQQNSSTKPIENVENRKQELKKPTVHIPGYGQRKGWIPRKQEDFGGGGAYPEIHVAQYPLGMGFKKNKKGNNHGTIVLRKENELATQGQRSDKIIYSNFSDMVAKSSEGMTLEKPSEEEQEQLADQTKNALERVINRKIAASYKGGPHKKTQSEEVDNSTFYMFTPAKTANNEEPSTKIVKVEDAPVDPLEPPKFRSKKIPRGPPSPPVPILHSPDKKPTREEAESWRIPPCISNWKNSKGFTIPLDKRLAADGSNLHEVQINDNFAKVAEALHIADQKAREELEKRAQYEKLKRMKEKEEEEEMYRKLAQEARQIHNGGTTTNEEEEQEEEEGEEEDVTEIEERNKWRQQRRLEREFERRQKAYKQKQKDIRDGDRDISEKIALGQAGKPSVLEGDIDTRLMNMSSGMDSGFGTEDSYEVFDKPLLKGSASQIYRPRNIENTDIDSIIEKSNQFEKEKKPSGRDGPVQFEREKEEPTTIKKKAAEEEADPFGFGKFLSETKSNAKKSLDHIGKRGMMGTTAGSGSGARDSDSFSKRSRIEFEKSSSNKRQRL